MNLATGATTAQMRAGDVLIEKGRLHGQTVESATSVGFVAATLPVLAEYNDGQGGEKTETILHSQSDFMLMP